MDWKKLCFLKTVHLFWIHKGNYAYTEVFRKETKVT